MTSGPYDALFDHVLTRVDAEKAHRLGFAGIRAAAPATGRLPTRRRTGRTRSA